MKKWVVLFGLLWLVLGVKGFTSPKPFDGCFIGIYQGDKKAWDNIRWGKELLYLRNVGMNTVILSYAVNSPNAFYNGCTLSGATTLDDTLGKVLTIADTTGMKIIIGLYGDTCSFSANGNKTGYLTFICNQSKTVCNDIWTNYGTHSSLMGWYIPQEVDNANWTTETKRQTLVNNFLRPLSDYCRTKDTTKVISEAPFFNDTLQSAADYGTFWKNNLADCTSLNVLIPQDGIAVPHSDFTTVTYYFSALQSACTSNKRVIWTDIEIYNSLADQGSASIGRVTTQILVEDTYVTGKVNWEYYSCMCPLNSQRTQDLYNAYENYAKGPNLAAGRTYTVSPTPHASYPDDGVKLTNAQYPYSWTSQVGWQRPTTNPTITIDLGTVCYNLGEVRGYCMRSDGSAVYAPQYITVYGSNDNSHFTSYGNAYSSATDNQYINLYQWNGNLFNARYVQLVIQPSTNNQFSMINEVSVRQGTQSMVPVELSEFVANPEE